mgnify:FL=1
MNFERFVAWRISLQSKRSFSRLVVRLAIAAIALSISVMLVSLAVVTGFQGKIKDKVTGFAAPVQVTKFRFGESFEFEPIALNTSLMQEIATLKSISHVHPFATKAGIARAGGEIEGIVTKGIDTHFNWHFIERQMVNGGRFSLPDSAPSDGIVISQYLARRLQLSVGDELLLYFVQDPPRARKLTITGIYSTDLEDIDKVYCLIDLRHVRKLNNWEDGQIAGYEVFTRRRNDDAIEAAVGEVFDALPPSLTARSVQQRFPQLYDWLALLDVNVQIILTLMVLVASINMVTALLIMMLERTPMIGLLKALGTANWSVRRIFVYNAAWLIGLGILIGNGMALLFMLLQAQFGLVTLPAESYYLSTVPIRFDWLAFTLVNVGTLIFCSLVMLIPSAFVSRIDPVRALRFG